MFDRFGCLLHALVPTCPSRITSGFFRTNARRRCTPCSRERCHDACLQFRLTYHSHCAHVLVHRPRLVSSEVANKPSRSHIVLSGRYSRALPPRPTDTATVCPNRTTSLPHGEGKEVLSCQEGRCGLPHPTIRQISHAYPVPERRNDGMGRLSAGLLRRAVFRGHDGRNPCSEGAAGCRPHPHQGFYARVSARS